MKLDRADHAALVPWAADCTEHVLPIFEDMHPGDDRAAGGSGIWAPDGSIVARAGPETGAIARATISQMRGQRATS